MLIVSQNGAQVLVLENLGSIFSDASNKVRCVNSQNGGGSELARYENREQTRYEMDALTIAYEMRERYSGFRIPLRSERIWRQQYSTDQR